MVFFNYALRKLNAKIVYYGPGLCGKTTNLQWIHDHFEGGQRGKMISLATEGDRTIFFDLLPIDIGSIRGMDVTLQLYTVPGQVHYNSTRQLVLRGADGVVFVADSQRTMKPSNAESFENLQENLMLQGIDLKDFPHILQFNKRDLRDLLSPEDLNESLNVFSCPIFEAIGTEGIGVQESLEGIVKLVMRNLREKYEPVASASSPQALKPMQATVPKAFQAATAEPTVGTRDPLASDFVSALESPPEVDLGGVSTPDVAAAPIETPAPVESARDETPDIGSDAKFDPFGDEDEISTAVYEPDDEQIAVAEAELDLPDFGAEAPTFAPAEEAQSNELIVGESGEFGGLFTDPRDEDGTNEDVAAPVSAVIEPEPDPIDDPRDEPGDDLDTDPGIVNDLPEPVPSDESLDDLFETEVPTVKAFVDDVMEVVETQGAVAGDRELAPASVDPSEMVADALPTDRYEDRIEAPGPFAPAPTQEEPADEFEASRAEEEAVLAEVRQALGASENREALASISDSEIDESQKTVEIAEDPIEAEPVVVPAAEEPVLEDVAEEIEDVTPVEVVIDEPEVTADDESGWEDQDNTTTEVAELVEPPVVTPVFDDIIVEVAPVEESVSAEPIAQEEVADEPVAPPTMTEKTLTKSQAFMLGSGDPFAEDDAVAVVPEVIPQGAPVVPTSNAINVTAQDNQLHLQLKGSGAIAEIGEVRALDIEVPVPGGWVGNRKVTLQLRLTLTPSDDMDD
jgi:signal recognition particle receptor subunit beta